MSVLDTDENRTHFLKALHQKAGDNAGFVISMYEIGEILGMDRDLAQKTAESLMGEGLVEIKTLSGGIGITESGIKKISDLTGGKAPNTSTQMTLSGDAVIGEKDRELIETTILNLKNAVNELNLDFDDLADLIIDIKSIELQLTATSPKTPIIRECFQSIKNTLAKGQNSGVLKQVKLLLGN